MQGVTMKKKKQLITQRHCFGIFYIEVYQNRSGNMEIIGGNSFTTLNVPVVARISTQFTPAFEKNSVSNSYAEKFLTDCLVADTGSGNDMRLSFYFLNIA